MARDKLPALLRLRELAFDESRRALRAAVDAEADAETAEREAHAAILRERDAAASLEVGDHAVEAFATWLPRGQAARAAAQARHCAASLATAHARAQLAAARAGVEAVKAAIARRAETARLEANRRAQAVMDELGSRRRE